MEVQPIKNQKYFFSVACCVAYLSVTCTYASAMPVRRQSHDHAARAVEKVCWSPARQRADAHGGRAALRRGCVDGLGPSQDAASDRVMVAHPRRRERRIPPCLPTLASHPSHESAKQKLKKAGRRTAEEQEETGEKTETTGEGDD